MLQIEYVESKVTNPTRFDDNAETKISVINEVVPDDIFATTGANQIAIEMAGLFSSVSPYGAILEKLKAAKEEYSPEAIGEIFSTILLNTGNQQLYYDIICAIEAMVMSHKSVAMASIFKNMKDACDLESTSDLQTAAERISNSNTRYKEYQAPREECVAADPSEECMDMAEDPKED